MAWRSSRLILGIQTGPTLRHLLLNSPKKVAKLPADVIPTLESHMTITDTTEGRHLVANPYFHIVDTQGNQLPYISEQDEVYKNDNELRILTLVNGRSGLQVTVVATVLGSHAFGRSGKRGLHDLPET